MATLTIEMIRKVKQKHDKEGEERERESERRRENAPSLVVFLRSVRSPPSLFSFLFSSFPRQRAEHNEGILRTLEELSLNQLGLINLGFFASDDGDEQKRKRKLPSSRSLLPRACRNLRHLSLAGNSLPRLPCGPRDLGLCKELRTLNVALNAIEGIRRRKRRGSGEEGEGEKGDDAGGDDDEEEGPLSACESLERLDLSGNFISKATVRETVHSLNSAPALKSLWLCGCPVAVGWEGGYRLFVVGGLPRLRELVRVFFLQFFVLSFSKKNSLSKAHGN